MAASHQRESRGWARLPWLHSAMSSRLAAAFYVAPSCAIGLFRMPVVSRGLRRLTAPTRRKACHRAVSAASARARCCAHFASAAIRLLDRLGRSLRHLLAVLAELSERGVAFRSLTEAIDTTTAAGRLQVHLFAALTEFERSLGQERTRAGLEAARARGRPGGRPAVVTSRKLTAALVMREQGELTMTQIAEELGVSPASLYRRLALHRRETEANEALLS